MLPTREAYLSIRSEFFILFKILCKCNRSREITSIDRFGDMSEGLHLESNLQDSDIEERGSSVTALPTTAEVRLDESHIVSDATISSRLVLMIVSVSVRFNCNSPGPVNRSHRTSRTLTGAPPPLRSRQRILIYCIYVGFMISKPPYSV